jgi:hypothetical protein
LANENKMDLEKSLAKLSRICHEVLLATHHPFKQALCSKLRFCCVMQQLQPWRKDLLWLSSSYSPLLSELAFCCLLIFMPQFYRFILELPGKEVLSLIVDVIIIGGASFFSQSFDVIIMKV